MPHVDEGTLHALLDGALRAEEPARADSVEDHLRSCRDCRARLDEAAGLRGGASDILAAAAPTGAGAPDFAEVLERVRRNDSAETTRESGAAEQTGIEAPAALRPASGRRRRKGGIRRQARWTRDVAWAASLVIALGTGYLLRDVADPASDPLETRAPLIRDSEPAGQSVSEGLTNPANEMNAREAAGDAATTQPAPPPPAGEEGGGEPPAPGPPEVSGEAVQLTGPVQGSATENVILREQSGLGGAAATKALADRAGARTELRSRIAAPPPATADAPATEESWTVARLEQARSALGGSIYRLPRATLREIYVSEGSALPAVLTLQVLESGVPVRVVQRRGAAMSSSARAEEAAQMDGAEEGNAVADEGNAGASAGLPGPEVVRVTRGDFVLEVTGSLPAELLAILAESATPAP